MQETSPQPLSQDYTRVQISELERGDKLRILWSWFWRVIVFAVVVTIVAMVFAGIVGFIIGLVFALSNIDIHPYSLYLQIIGGVIGGLVGFFGYYFFIKWITNSRFGAYEFWLVKRRGA